MPAVTLADVEREALACTACRLGDTRATVVFGVGSAHADLMFVGEAPGAEEDKKGEPFVGRSGKLLDKLVFEEMGLTRDEFFIANCVKCRPPGNRDPKEDELAACSRFLDLQIELIAPKVIVTLGNFATRRLLGTSEGITKVRGNVYPFRAGVLVPTYHPSAALQGGGAEVVARIRSDLVRAKFELAKAA